MYKGQFLEWNRSIGRKWFDVLTRFEALDLWVLQFLKRVPLVLLQEDTSS